ncbi:hypothetical protein LA345_13440 [Burkholderia vietnamiensis]|nr:hypothetical protein [Burkholderia vietnamiensis]
MSEQERANTPPVVSPQEMANLRRRVQRQTDPALDAITALIEPWRAVAREQFAARFRTWTREALAIDDALTGEGSEDAIEDFMGRAFENTSGRLLASGFFGRPERALLDPAADDEFAELWGSEAIDRLLATAAAVYWEPIVAAQDEATRVDAIRANPFEEFRDAMNEMGLKAVSSIEAAIKGGDRSDSFAQAFAQHYPTLATHRLVAIIDDAVKAGVFARALLDEDDFTWMDEVDLARAAREALSRDSQAGATTPGHSKAAMMALAGLAIWHAKGEDTPTVERYLNLPISPDRWLAIAASSEDGVGDEAPQPERWLREAIGEQLRQTRALNLPMREDEWGWMEPCTPRALRECIEGSFEQGVFALDGFAQLAHDMIQTSLETAPALGPDSVPHALRAIEPQALSFLGVALTEGLFSRLESVSTKATLPARVASSRDVERCFAPRSLAALLDLTFKTVVAPLLHWMTGEARASRASGHNKLLLAAAPSALLSESAARWQDAIAMLRERSGRAAVDGDRKARENDESQETRVALMYSALAVASFGDTLNESVPFYLAHALLDTQLGGEDDETFTSNSAREALIALRNRIVERALDDEGVDINEAMAITLLAFARMLSLGQSDLGAAIAKQRDDEVRFALPLFDADSATAAAATWIASDDLGGYAVALNAYARAFVTLATAPDSAEDVAQSTGGGTASSGEPAGATPEEALVGLAELARALGAATDEAEGAVDNELLVSARKLQDVLNGLTSVAGSAHGVAGQATLESQAATASASTASTIHASSDGDRESDSEATSEHAPLYPTPFDPQKPSASDPDGAFLDMSFFEPRRLEIAQACAQALMIDASEFAFGQETMQFHFFTQLVAVGEWLGDRLMGIAYAGHDEILDDSREGDGQWTQQAFAQLLAGLFARLLRHPVYMGAVEPGSQEAKVLEVFINVALRDCSDLQAQRRVTGVSLLLSCWNAATQGLMRGLRVFAEGGAESIGVRLDELDEIEPQLREALLGGSEDEPFPFDSVRHAVAMLWTEAHHLFESSKSGPLRVMLQLSPTHPDVELLSTFKRFLGLYGFHRRPMELVRDRITGEVSLAPFDGRLGDLLRVAGTARARFVLEACRTRTVGRWAPGDPVDLLVFQPTTATTITGERNPWDATRPVMQAAALMFRDHAQAGHQSKVVLFGQALL